MTVSLCYKKSIRIINFATFNRHTNPLFLEDKIIKFPDIIKLNQLMLVQQFNNKTLPRQLENLMEHIANIHNHFIHTSSNTGLFIPQISSTNFGSYSLNYMAPYVWNNFSRVHPDICNYNSCKRLKKIPNQIFSGTIQMTIMKKIAFFSSSSSSFFLSYLLFSYSKIEL